MFEASPSSRNSPLPAQLERKLELARIVGGGRLAGSARCAGGWVAKLIHGSDVGAVEQVEGVGDEIESESFAEGDALGETHIPLEKVGRSEAVAAKVAVATGSGRCDARNAECRTAICQADIRHAKRYARDER